MTFIREWRKFRGLTQAQLVERLYTMHNLEFTEASISRLENGKQSYTQPVLEAIADALSCEPADLLMRNPADDSAIWSVWEGIPPKSRSQALRVLKAFSGKPGSKKRAS